MIAGILKTAAICLSSLGSFDITRERNAEIQYQITQSSAQVNTEDYWTNGQTPSPTMPLPRSYSKSTYWRWQNTAASFYLTEINNMYVQSTRTDNNTTYQKYILNYQNEPYTFGMYLLKIEQTEGQINNINNAWMIYLNTQLQTITNCNTLITQYEIITEKQEIIDYWENPTPLALADSRQTAEQGSAFNLGKYIYNKILHDNEVNYTAKQMLYQQNIPFYAFAPNSDDQILDIAYNTTMYYIILVNFENTNQYIETTSKPQYIVNALNSGWTIDLITEQITGTINYEIVDVPGLCFTILTMPFTFISQAFNVKLFPGTPYQLNISYLFLAIIGIMTFIFIMKKLLGR